MGVSITMMMVLIFFRKSQRKIDNTIDEAHLTPQDYTIIVKNIPKKLKTDYKKELEHIFTNNVVPDEKMEISKITLVYNMDYLIELEVKLDEALKRK